MWVSKQADSSNTGATVFCAETDKSPVVASSSGRRRKPSGVKPPPWFKHDSSFEHYNFCFLTVQVFLHLETEKVSKVLFRVCFKKSPLEFFQGWRLHMLQAVGLRV